MSTDDDARLQRLREDLAALRAKALERRAPTAGEIGDRGDPRAGADRTEPAENRSARDRPAPDRAAAEQTVEHAVEEDAAGDEDRTDVATLVDATSRGATPTSSSRATDRGDDGPAGRSRRPAPPPPEDPGKPPKPPRRNPLRRRRPKRPPRRLAVPTPIPVKRRSEWLAGPRWPVLTAAATAVIVVVMIPVVAQLAFRLWTAMSETSFLLGAEPSRSEALRAAAGVAGGGITTALAVFALGVVRGRPGYLGGGVALLLLFVAFPFLAYTANAGIVSAPIPTLGEMIAPQGWPRGDQLAAVFLLALGALVAAVVDLLYRSATAVGRGLRERDR